MLGMKNEHWETDEKIRKESRCHLQKFHKNKSKSLTITKRDL